jgi:ABC-type antimicrobial peptide transport system permease subunit
MDAYWLNVISRERLGAALMLGLGAFGLSLAALGVYGVIGFSVARRTGEIGLRMALGGRPRDIMRLVLGRAVWLVAGGLAIGIAGSLALNRMLAALLSEIGTVDVRAIGTAAVLVTAAALGACLLPALKATRLDPLTAIRSD